MEAALKLIRLFAVAILVVALPSCTETPTQPDPPGTPPPPATPANVTLTVQQANANPSAQLFPQPPASALNGRFTFTWENDGGSPATITGANFRAVHLGGRDVTRPLILAESTTVLPNDRLIFNYDYFYTANTGAPNSRLLDFLGTSTWIDTANNLTGTADTPFQNANNDDVAPDTRSCDPGSTIACLQDGRFRVTADFRTPGGTLAAAIVHPDTTNDSASFYFLDPNNIEAVLQVIDQCAPFNRFWVFAAATTNVEFTLRVTDTQVGEVRSYFKPVGPPEPITDTEAFATCPGPIPVPVP
jgi:hypothetical protein